MNDYEGQMERLLDLYKKAGTQPPIKEELSGILQIENKTIPDLLRLSVEKNKLVRINDSIYLDSQVFDSIIEELKGFLREKKEITVAEFRDIFKTSRKYAVPILEYLDVIKFTMRVGDKRVLRMPYGEFRTSLKVKG